ncbi:P-loop containing nucleoside triphosphate hydrolase protein [Annulohypoxylon stygium]|nr:P-loop containing nucleoside triphosphate hydrolase protein [Annulohypoxylon stygium]
MESSATSLEENSNDFLGDHRSESNQTSSPQLKIATIKFESLEDEHYSNREQSMARQSTTTQHLILEVPCPVTGANHSNLLQFGVHTCPKCQKPIYEDEDDARAQRSVTTKKGTLATGRSIKTKDASVEIKMKDGLNEIHQIRDDVSWLRRRIEGAESDSEYEESDGDGSQDESLNENDPDMPGQGRDDLGEPDRTKIFSESPDAQEISYLEAQNMRNFSHDIEFRDEGGGFLHHLPWNRPFSLVEAQKGIIAQSDDIIAKITTVLGTNHRGQHRSDLERLRIIKSGLLRNPRVNLKSLRQHMLLLSKPIMEVLQKIITYYPGTNIKSDMLLLDFPYCILVHHAAELESFKNTFDGKDDNSKAADKDKNISTSVTSLNWPSIGRCDKTTFDHIEQLLHFLRSNLFSNDLETELARHSRDAPVCTFPMLWLLYKPGSTVYVTNAAGEASAYIVKEYRVNDKQGMEENTRYPGMPPTMPPPGTLSFGKSKKQPLLYDLILWNLNFDGQYVRRYHKTVTIGHFDGERPILDLQTIPARFVDASDRGKTREKLIERGRKWYGMLTGAQQWHYSGPTYSPDEKVIDTRVVIDIGAYLGQRPSTKTEEKKESEFMISDIGDYLAICQCEKCLGGRPHPPKNFPWAEYDMIDPRHGDLELPENYPDRQHRYLLCSGRLMGLALRTRTWEELDVQRCHPPKINTKAIDSLVMPDERKRMIKAVVRKYTDPRFTPGKSAPTWGADFIEKKGEGQIFLLHGGPGVGKTFTAECISELIGRPLLSLTCADFGTVEEEMERNLSKWFKLGEKWGAVMLLDEADVWLEKRIISDLRRNTLVAVFLRCLEYYRGILFLTSNRVGTFDDAFISRIHVVIYYEDLGEPQRKQIWKQFFDKLERERKDTIIVESRAKHFVLNDSEMRKIPWNGREIRNAFQTAVSLAEYRYHYEGGKDESDTVVLDKVDFEQVCQMSVDFKEYLKRVHRGDDENDRAMRERTRA